MKGDFIHSTRKDFYKEKQYNEIKDLKIKAMTGKFHSIEGLNNKIEIRNA